MNRPYVICHILSSLDGKINGPFMAAEATGMLSGAYGSIRREMNADAWVVWNHNGERVFKLPGTDAGRKRLCAGG